MSRHILLLFVSFFLYKMYAVAQPGYKVDIDKPKPYTERKLKAEKTGEGKLKPVKRIWQNLTTHYNYVFNANNKLTEVLDRAREQHKDDYSQLLPFYNYQLEVTAADSAQLDSIIYKARTGILNHDLRSEWADELYLLWAQAWHLEKKFDSAALMLQFINYAFAPQYDDGFYKYIGSNTDGAKQLTIVTKEEKHFLHNNIFSRNNAFVWQVRNRTEMGDYTYAGSLITTLRRDPLFPPRLDNPLHEAEAYWHYSQKHWDSAAAHLLAALDGDYTKTEKARWTYLAAQMLEKAGRQDEALKLYEKVVAATPDPVMEVYARLNVVRLSKEGGEKAFDINLAALLKMAKKDKYEDYRDIIYYMAAQMELDQNNIPSATEFLIKGTKAGASNPASRNKVFLQIADVLYDQKKYVQASSFYDSIEVEELDTVQAARVMGRIPALQKIVLGSGIVGRQDSLQRVAALPQEERDALIKKTLKRLRKEQGLKEEPAAPTSSGSSFPAAANNPPADLFATDQKGEWYFYNSNAKSQGQTQFKSTWGNRPNADNWRRFAAVNQQLLSSPDRVVESPDSNSPENGANGSGGADLSFEGLLAHLPTTPETLKASNDSIRDALFLLGNTYLNEIEDYPSAIATFEEIRRRFPDAERMEEILFNLSYAYNKTGNTTAAAEAKKLLTEKYPDSRLSAIASTGKDPEAKLTPEATKAYEHVYDLFIEGSFAQAENAKHIADSTYKTNYWEPQLLYIEAVYYIKQRQDSIADNVLGTIISQNTNQALTEKAQLLQSVLARRKEIEDELTKLQITRPSDNDSVAKEPVVQKPIVKKDTVAVVKPAVDSVALAKERQKHIADSLADAKATAQRLLDSLNAAKRDSIALAKQNAAKALRDAQDKKALADKQKRDSIALAKQEAAKALRDSLERKAIADKAKRDSTAKAKLEQDRVRLDSIALAKALRDQARDSLALSKYLAKRRTDSLARIRNDSLAVAKEKAAQNVRDSLARKALATKQRQDSIALAKEKSAQAKRDSITLQTQLAKQRKDSIAAVKAAKEQARKDSLTLAKTARDQARKDSIAAALAAKRERDSIAAATKPPVKSPVLSSQGYTFDPKAPHYAVVVLEKVDPIFVNEARNAFLRYNKESHYGESLDVQIVNVTTDTRLLIISGLADAAAATDWVEKAKPLASTEIVPWLTGNKYTFSIISAPNLDVLKAKGDMSGYKKFLEQVLPGKF